MRGCLGSAVDAPSAYAICTTGTPAYHENWLLAFREGPDIV